MVMRDVNNGFMSLYFAMLLAVYITLYIIWYTAILADKELSTSTLYTSRVDTSSTLSTTTFGALSGSTVLAKWDVPCLRTNYGFKVRYFSATRLNYADKCDCCGKGDDLTSRNKKKLKDFTKEYESNHPVPVLKETEEIYKEKGVNIAAAYQGDPDGISKRVEDIKARFKGIIDQYGEYFKDKFEDARKKFNEDRLNKGKDEVCDEKIRVYLDKHFQDSDKLLPSRLRYEHETMSFLSKQAYYAFLHANEQHKLAAQYLLNNKKLVDKKGDASLINKDLFKKLTVEYKDDDGNIKETVYSSQNTEIQDQKDLGLNKRSIEEIGESSTDSANKRTKMLSWDEILSKSEEESSTDSTGKPKIPVEELVEKGFRKNGESSTDSRGNKPKIPVEELVEKGFRKNGESSTDSTGNKPNSTWKELADKGLGNNKKDYDQNQNQNLCVENLKTFKENGGVLLSLLEDEDIMEFIGLLCIVIIIICLFLYVLYKLYKCFVSLCWSRHYIIYIKSSSEKRIDRSNNG